MKATIHHVNKIHTHVSNINGYVVTTLYFRTDKEVITSVVCYGSRELAQQNSESHKFADVEIDVFWATSIKTDVSRSLYGYVRHIEITGKNEIFEITLFADLEEELAFQAK